MNPISDDFELNKSIERNEGQAQLNLHKENQRKKKGIKQSTVILYVMHNKCHTLSHMWELIDAFQNFAADST